MDLARPRETVLFELSDKGREQCGAKSGASSCYVSFVIMERLHIYKASSRAALLKTVDGCIEGHESLYTKAGMLQRDISINNLVMNEDDNPSWRSFLIDLDLAIKEQREGTTGAPGKTGTRAFMAIGVLHDDEKHSFMHDLESFFWVLFWICIHCNGPNEERVPQFDKWKYADTEELARLKLGTVSDEGIFRKTVTEHFTEYYKPLILWLNRLRRVVFQHGLIDCQLPPVETRHRDLIGQRDGGFPTPVKVRIPLARIAARPQNLYQMAKHR